MSGSRDNPDSAGRQLGELLELVRKVLELDLVGAYLHGSAVLGGQLPTSDLDLLVVSRRSTTIDERNRLVERLVSLSVPPDDERHGHSELRPIELTIVVDAAIRPWRFPPEMEFQYGDWLRPDIERGHIPAPCPNGDLAVLIELARRGNWALIGPPPAELFEPVPWPDVVAAMTGGIDELLARLQADTRNVLLTLARIWMTLATGAIRRKDAAALWAAERLPRDLAAVLERARALYLEGEYGPWDKLAPAVRPTAHRVVSEIRRLA